MTTLKQLERLMERATPLPWAEGISSHHTVSKGSKFLNYHVAEFHHARDAELVDAAVNALPKLIAALREARDALEFFEQTAICQADTDVAVEALKKLRALEDE